MKGHIRKRGKSWAVVLDLGRDASWQSVGRNGMPSPELVGMPSVNLRGCLNEINTGAYVEPSRMTVSEFLDRWLADYAKPKVSPKTYERYQEMIDGHISLPSAPTRSPNSHRCTYRPSTAERWPLDERTEREASRRRAWCISIGC